MRDARRTSCAINMFCTVWGIELLDVMRTAATTCFAHSREDLFCAQPRGTVMRTAARTCFTHTSESALNYIYVFNWCFVDLMCRLTTHEMFDGDQLILCALIALCFHWPTVMFSLTNCHVRVRCALNCFVLSTNCHVHVRVRCALNCFVLSTNCHVRALCALISIKMIRDAR